LEGVRRKGGKVEIKVGEKCQREDDTGTNYLPERNAKRVAQSSCWERRRLKGG